MQNWYFRADIRCHLRNGDTQTLRDYEVAVEAFDRQDAIDGLEAVATNMIDDAGSKLLDCPLDHIEVIRYRDDGTTGVWYYPQE